VTQTTLYFYTKRVLSVLITILIVSSCVTPKKTGELTQPKPSNNSAQISDQENAKDYLDKASGAEPTQAIAYMLKAANTYNEEEKYIKSLWLSGELIKLPLNNEQRFNTLLVKISSLLALNKHEDVNQQLSLVNNLITQFQILPNKQYYQLTARIEKNKGNNVKASYAGLLALNSNNLYDEVAIMTLWSDLSTLAHWELQQLKKLQPPEFMGWLAIIEEANKWGNNKVVLDEKLMEFQSQYPNHSANFIAEQLMLVSQIDEPLIKNVAILLPLSGQHKGIGEIVQQGILAAYQNNETRLIFIDTNNLDFTGLSLRFVDENIDHVLGPLLKPNVDQYIAQNDIQLPTLMLNIPTLENLSDQQFAFSMKREDEAIQAATVLANENYKHPIIFSTQDGVSQKIALTFAKKWQLLTGGTPETVMLEANEKMQESLKTSLDIDVSKARIRNLEAQIKQKIETENRNRRDIDMIYIAAPTVHTRLIKPFIDVNTSTYSNTIPMFASSLSYNGTKDEGEIRDLSGLTFSEIPWLLENPWQNKVANKTSETLWPNRSESLQRIYALGYDSFSILNKLEQMKKLPYLRHYGQTGELKIGENNIISRSIIWGQYANGTVKEVVME